MDEPFSCLQCGECCKIRGYVYLEEGELEMIAAFLGIDQQTCVDRYTRLSPDRRSLCLIETPGGECIFLEKNRCAIHPVKPIQCRSFPVRWHYPGFEEICRGMKQFIFYDPYWP
jgi:hypothetical protein